MKWSSTEDEILIEHYKVATNSELCDLFPGRKLDAIRYHARQLGLVRDRQVYELKIDPKKSWTKEEDEILKDNYGKAKSIDELMSLLPNRTPMSIYGRAFKYRLKRPLFTPPPPVSKDTVNKRREQVKAMILEGKTQREISAELGVSYGTINNDVWRLGLIGTTPEGHPSNVSNSDKVKEIKEKLRQKLAKKSQVNLKSWEKRILLDYGRSMSLVEIAMLLPRRSKYEIKQAARHFGIEIKE